MSDQSLKLPVKRIKVKGQFKNLQKVLGFVLKFSRKAGFTEADTYKLQLAVDEAFSNIIEHAYSGEDLGEIECSCEYKDGAITIRLIDYGQSFDPNAVDSPDLHSDLKDRKIGGLGLYFIHQLMDDVKFYKVNQDDPLISPGFSNCPCNILEMVKRKPNHYET